MKACMFPSEGIADGIGTYKLEIILDKSIVIGGGLKISPFRKVANYWVPVQNTSPGQENYIKVCYPERISVRVEIKNVWDIIITLEQGFLAPGDRLTVVYGNTSSGSPGLKLGSLAGRAEFNICQYSYSEEEQDNAQVFVVIVPEKPAKLCVRMRKNCGKNSIILKAAAIDKFGNTTHNAPSQLEIEPAAGLEQIETMEFPETGKSLATSHIKIKDRMSCPLIEVTAPALSLKSYADPFSMDKQLYWGDLHCHTRLAQALETPDFLYEYAKNDAALDFLCHVEHYCDDPYGWIQEREWRTWHTNPASLKDYIKDVWIYQQELVRRNYKPEHFVSLLGFEWASNIYGHMNVIYPTDKGSLIYPEHFFKPDITPQDLFDRLSGRDAIIIPHHPSWPVFSTPYPPGPSDRPIGQISGVDWNFYNKRLTRLVEICSKHGVSEYFGCHDAINCQTPEGTVKSALARGYHLGFTGSTDSHASRPGSYSIPGDLWSEKGGITAVFCEKLDRASIYEALRKRSCYATTGARIILDFSVNNQPMGSEITCTPDTERIIKGSAMGTEKIEHIEFIKNGKTALCLPDVSGFDYVDREEIEEEDYYYMRVMQEDGHQAWASPVYVDTYINNAER